VFGAPRSSGRPVRLLSVAALAVAIAAALVSPSAQAARPAAQAAPSGWSATAVDSVARSFGLTHAQAVQRLQEEASAQATAGKLTVALGTRAAGSFIDSASGGLVVNVLDAAAAAQVRASGATARMVSRSLASLDRIKASLDRLGAVAGTAWAVDIQSNAVVVSVPRGAAAAATTALLARARSYGSAVRVDRTAGGVSTQAFYGGQAILSGGSRCSAGFITRVPSSGNQYVVTAGHCTNIGTNWRTSSGQTIGRTAASRFPGDDFGAIRIANPTALQPRGGVLNKGVFQDITGASRVPVNSTVCKTGSTTGTTCGRVLRYNTTVNYPQGTVRGLTTTNVCTQPGDSGGPLFAGRQAQGVTSGGTVGSCSQAGFRSFFQPADEILTVFGLQLV
jgi:streptogrisin D